MALLALAIAGGCRRGPRLSGEAYAESVAAFHTSLAAMQTSQDVLARRHLERLTQLAPEEPAGWANLGLLFLRQQQIDEAIQRITRAAELAPGNASIHRLLALAQTQKGNTDAAIRHWRRAVELDPADPKAPFALAQELERQGRPAEEAEAQRILASLVDRSGNLAARLELARLAAKRGDCARPLGRSRRVRTGGPLVASRGPGASGDGAPGRRRRAGERRDPGHLPEERADSFPAVPRGATPP